MKTKKKIKNPLEGTNTNHITDINFEVRTHSSLQNLCSFFAFVYDIEPKSHFGALNDSKWIIAMQDQLNQLKRNKV